MLTNKLVAGQQSDMLLMKYDKYGDLLWEDTYNGTFNGRDYGVAAAVDNASNVYVAGVSQSGPVSSVYLVCKYSPAGLVQWTATYSGNGLYNVPTALTVDNTGNVYVTGVALSLLTQTDYATVKFSPTGQQLWAQTYDYTSLYEYPACIEVNPFAGQVYVTGASASSSNNYDYATVAYDLQNGGLISVNRSAATGTGFDKVTALIRDNAGNLYLTGQAYEQTSGSYDIKTLKLDAALNVLWVHVYDKIGLDDLGSSIALDNAGNVYVGGYAGTTDEQRNAIVLKYDNTGTLVWVSEYNNHRANRQDEVRQLTLNSLEGLIFAAVNSEEDAGDSEWVLLILDTDGEIRSEIRYENPFYGKDESSDIRMDNAGNVYLSGSIFDGTANQNASIKYGILNLGWQTVYDSLNTPLYRDRQTIVKFRPEFVNPAFVDNRGLIFTGLKSAIPDSLIEAMEAKAGIMLRNAKAVKIFSSLTRQDSLSITRLGDTIKMPPLWSVLIITIPPNANVRAVTDSIKMLTQFIEYAHPNHLGTLDSPPNDTHYAAQHSLESGQYVGAHINIGPAWDIQTGTEDTKVGIYDYVIDWSHPDFGNGTYAGSKIKGGADYTISLPPKHISTITQHHNNHGTACAGIVGALRNNGIGVSGIAGGDVDIAGNKGVSLYSFGITQGSTDILLSAACKAIEDGANHYPATGDTLYVHLMNHSWSKGAIPPDDYQLLKEAVKVAWLNGCVFVASRGNENNELPRIPAEFPDNWLLCVGASGTDGLRKVPYFPNNPASNGDAACYQSDPTSNWGSSYGPELDVMAPGVTDLILTTKSGGVSNPYSCMNFAQHYSRFGGTSAAAPHVAGVAALMLSEHQPANGYPNRLAPEDVERLLQLYATDVFTPNYDDQNGWGRINAGSTLTHLRMPAYCVLHSKQPSTVTHDTLPQQIVGVSEYTDGILAGSYSGYRVVITEEYLIQLPTPNTQVIRTWIRASATSGMTGSFITDDRGGDSVSMTILPGNVAYIVHKTSCWYLDSTNNGVLINKWLPNPPGQARVAISLYLHDPTLSSLPSTALTGQLRVFPNPVEEVLTIESEAGLNETAQIEIADMTGKILLSRTLRLQDGRTQLPIEKLPTGVYSLRVQTPLAQSVHKLIKQ